MVVAVVAVRMMKVSIHEIIFMVSVRNAWMPTVGSMDMMRHMFLDGEPRGALVGICGADGNHMIIHMGAMHVMQVAGVEVVGMSVMENRDMAATRPVNMSVLSTMYHVGFAGE